MFFSKQTNGFYPEELLEEYRKTGNLPSDLVSFTKSEYESAISCISSGGDIAYSGGKLSVINKVPTLAEKKEACKSQIDDLRVSTEKKGVSYTFSDVQDAIQLRSADDFINILGVVNTAQIMIAVGVEGTLPFRAESNTTYQLTPQDAISLGVAVSSFRQSLYQKAWQYKEAVDACKSKSAVDAVMNGMEW